MCSDESKSVYALVTRKDLPRVTLGVYSSHRWRTDPKTLAFSLARYKFVAKMLSGKEQVLEVGCADGLGSSIIRQEVSFLHCIDVDSNFINEASLLSQDPNITFAVHDLTIAPLARKFEGIFLLDVLEHIDPNQEQQFLANISDSLIPSGVCIVGMPSLESQAYASGPSRAGHINCKTGPELKAKLSEFFTNVFLFSMNDEVVHTGYYQMAHYLFALCVGLRDEPDATE